MTQAKIVMATLAAVAFCAAPLASAQQQSGMITVDISGVSASVAKNLNIDAAQVPATILVPVAVAAKACGVAANVLTQQGGTGTPATCQAKNADADLAQLIQKGLTAPAPATSAPATAAPAVTK